MAKDAEVRVKRGGQTTLAIDLFFKVTGKELGFKKHTDEISMRAYVQARLPKEDNKKKR